MPCFYPESNKCSKNEPNDERGIGLCHVIAKIHRNFEEKNYPRHSLKITKHLNNRQLSHYRKSGHTYS